MFRSLDLDFSIVVLTQPEPPGVSFVDSQSTSPICLLWIFGPSDCAGSDPGTFSIDALQIISIDE